MPGSSSPVFLGWERPFLAAVAEWLIAHHGSDLHGWIVAVPGRRAARRLEERLVEQAGGALWSPRIVTSGRLTDELLEPSGARASRLVRTLVWSQALRSMGAEALAPLVRDPPAADDREGWWRLAEELRGLHGELLAPALRAFGDVLSVLPATAAAERGRWTLLTRVQAAYRTTLARLELLDPHDARRREVEAGRVRAPAGRVVLAGVTELSGLLRKTLSGLDAPAIPLVFAPESHAAGFDESGAVLPDFWNTVEVDLPDAAWEVADRPVEQADRVVTVLGRLRRAPAPDEITVGVPDEQVAPFLLRALAAEGVPACDGAGTKPAGTPPARLLAATAAWLGTGSFRDFAALVRHPDLLRHLHCGDDAREPDLLDCLDQWQAQTLPSDGPSTGLTSERWSPLSRARKRLDALLGDLTTRRREAASFWCAAIRAWLVRVQAGEEIEPGRRATLARLSAALDELEALPEPVARSLDLTAPEALRLLQRLLVDGEPLHFDSEEGKALLLGWLELALDDAPVLVVTGFNDGRVPASRRGHAFLPDGLRTRLGLPDDELRLARDMHVFSACLASRESVTVVSGRRTSENDPLLPSRLVFRCPEAALAARVRRFVGDEPSPSEVEPDTDAAPPTAAARAPEPTASAPRCLPMAAAQEPLDGLAVTAFKDYLVSPYAFYLGRVLRLRSIDDEAWELDPLAFGQLAHRALEAFGNSEVKSSTRPERIAGFLEAEVESGARSYGRHAAVAVQVEQLKRRMRRFAVAQAAWAADGWRIEQTEWTPSAPVLLDVPGDAFELRGKIDRIDRHPDGRWAIWDYKTGEQGGQLGKAHGRNGWRDLQLPLYLLLAHELGVPCAERPATHPRGLFDADAPSEALLGYIELARRDADAGFSVAHWSDAEIADAFVTAREVVRRIRAGKFSDLGTFPPYDPVLNALAGRGLLAGSGAETTS